VGTGFPKRSCSNKKIERDDDSIFPRWGVADAEAERAAEAVIDLFIEGIAARPVPS
jgi:hypothetical protein